MKIPETAPDWKKIFRDNPEKFTILIESKELLKDSMAIANKKYLYWDKFKYILKNKFEKLYNIQ